MATAECSDCGTPIPPGQDPPLPCPNCGSLHKTASGAVTISIGFAQSVTGVARSSNGVEARTRELDLAIGDIESSAGHIGDEQAATKRALELIHELSDALNRVEWDQSRWDADSIGLWHGLIGARNAGHHSQSPIVSAHSEPGEARLHWDIEPAAIQQLHSTRQQREYNARVAGGSVLAHLRTIRALLP
jgi:hypothetical protein